MISGSRTSLQRAMRSQVGGENISSFVRSFGMFVRLLWAVAVAFYLGRIPVSALSETPAVSLALTCGSWLSRAREHGRQAGSHRHGGAASSEAGAGHGGEKSAAGRAATAAFMVSITIAPALRSGLSERASNGK
ncbi:hypothetical protein K439DRAFT_1612776 [Ramaria rubella]|nr:hypothetical protein K439DRAFT_1612776 [Ramaria rubella]